MNLRSPFYFICLSRILKQEILIIKIIVFRGWTCDRNIRYLAGKRVKSHYLCNSGHLGKSSRYWLEISLVHVSVCSEVFFPTKCLITRIIEYFHAWSLIPFQPKGSRNDIGIIDWILTLVRPLSLRLYQGSVGRDENSGGSSCGALDCTRLFLVLTTHGFVAYCVWSVSLVLSFSRFIWFLVL